MWYRQGGVAVLTTRPPEEEEQQEEEDSTQLEVDQEQQQDQANKTPHDNPCSMQQYEILKVRAAQAGTADVHTHTHKNT